MIIIFSNSEDYTTKIVIEWLHFLGKKYIRLNKGDTISIDSISFDENVLFADLSFGNQRFSSRRLNSVCLNFLGLLLWPPQ